MKPAPRVTLLILLALTLAASGGTASAKSAAAAGGRPQAGAAVSDLDPAPVARLAAEVDQSEAQLDTVSLNARSVRLTDADLRARMAAVPPIQARLAAALDDLTPRLQGADARLAQLGPAPALGQASEDPEITKSRQEIQGYRRSVDTEVKQARLLETEADQLATYLAARRRELFSERLWVRGRSALDASLWRDFAFAIPGDLQRVQAVVGQDLRRLQAWAATTGGIARLLAALLLLGPARMLLNQMGERRLTALPSAGAVGPPAIALWWVLVAGMTPWLAGLVVQGGLSSARALTPEFGRLLTLIINAAVFAALFEGIGRALLAKGHAAWRLAPIPDQVADRLAPYPGLVGLSAGLAYLVAGVAAVLGLSPSTSEASQCLAILLEIAVLGAGLATLGHARGAHLPAGDDVPTSAAGSRAPWILAALVAWVALGGALAALMLGYVALAGLVIRELVWVAMVLAALFLLLRLVDELFPALFSPHRAVGRSLRLAIGLSATALEQSAELVAGLVRLGLLLCGWLAVIAPLGAGAEDVFGRVTSADLVIRLGQLSISPGAVAGAVLVFGLGLVATRALRRWLETRYLPKTRMDIGVRLSMASAVTYVGALVAFVLTCSYLGVSLDRIALLASALSVGIGFGLQAVIGNFVSGLVLLAERPVKVGDWIAIGDLEGDVTRISVRATEIEMRDRSKLIVPNSELISKTVRNVTRGGSLGRVKIVLFIENGSDPGVARDLLLDRLTSHPDTLADPPAAVYLTDVRDGALEMTAFAYVSSPRKVFNAKSDLLFGIVSDLKARGIGLASSSAVVNVGFPDRPIEPEAPGSFSVPAS
jgi:potassium efflux system protein